MLSKLHVLGKKCLRNILAMTKLKKNFINIGHIKFKFKKINNYRSVGGSWECN